MKSFLKFFTTALLFICAASALPAQSVSAFGEMPLWFESSTGREFVAHGAHSTLTITLDGATLALKNAGGQTASCAMQFVGAGSSAKISGTMPLAGKINRLLGNQPAGWKTGLTTYGKVLLENIYPGVDVVFYGNQKMLEYDFQLAPGADLSAIALKFAGADSLAITPQGSLVVKLPGGEMVQHPPVAYQTIAGVRKEIPAHYKIIGRRAVTFAVGAYDHSQPLVIDPLLSFSTFYGGDRGDSAWAIAVNPNDGSVYVAGQTFSTRFATGVPYSTGGAFQENYGGGHQAGDAFVARFDNTGTNLIYATYLGGSDDDAAYAIAVDGDGNAYVAGATMSVDFPTTNSLPGGAAIHGKKNSTLKNHATDAFIAKLDPSGSNLVYSSFIGGSSADCAYAITLDAAANAYLTGFTYSTNFPVTPGAFQPRLGTSLKKYLNPNAFVCSINADGSGPGYSTYLGGTNYDTGRSITFNNGRLFVAGLTTSTNFPETNALAGFSTLNGRVKKASRNEWHADAFVAAFDVSGTNLSILYSTYLGGTNVDAATGVAADAAGNAYVVGYTSSTNFPYTLTNVAGLAPAFVHTNDFQKHSAQVTNGFLTQITWDGTQPAVGASVMFGGRGVTFPTGVALDPAGNIYIAGFSTSTNFPVITNNLSWSLSATNSSKHKNKKPLSDATIMAFSPDAATLLYSAYLGGRDNDYGQAIAVDPSGTAYIAGRTASTNFPTINAQQGVRNGTNDMFIAKIAPDDMLKLAIVPAPANPAAQARPGEKPLPAQEKFALRWKMFPPAYEVESSTDISRPDWKPLPVAPSYTNGWYQLELPAAGPAQFFRLRPR